MAAMYEPPATTPMPHSIGIPPPTGESRRLSSSPKIIHKLILGEADLSMQTLRRSFPLVWEKQESELLR